MLKFLGDVVNRLFGLPMTTAEYNPFAVSVGNASGKKAKNKLCALSSA